MLFRILKIGWLSLNWIGNLICDSKDVFGDPHKENSTVWKKSQSTSYTVSQFFLLQSQDICFLASVQYKCIVQIFKYLINVSSEWWPLSFPLLNSSLKLNCTMKICIIFASKYETHIIYMFSYDISLSNYWPFPEFYQVDFL